LDFQYFTDPDDYDAKVLVDGIKQARLIAETKPFKDWLLEEVAPGPHVQSDDDLNLYARKASHTVYHPAVSFSFYCCASARLLSLHYSSIPIVTSISVQLSGNLQNGLA
jgi:hypothetical protein